MPSNTLLTASPRASPQRSATTPLHVSIATFHQVLTFCRTESNPSFELANGGHVVSILSFDPKTMTRENVKVEKTILYTNLTGEATTFGPFPFEAGAHDKEDLVRFYQLMPKLAVDSGIKYLEIEKLTGLANVLEGLELLKNGKVQGKKVVVINDTA